MDILISGLMLGGTYALVAMGLNLQYGVARIMNLANGETLVLGALAAWGLFTALSLSPLWTLLLVGPVAYAASWLLFRLLLVPLVRRAPDRGRLEADSILATFGMSFVLVGAMGWIHSEYFSYSWQTVPVDLGGVVVAANRGAAFLGALIIGGALWLWLERSEAGRSVRATAVNPEAAGLVGIDVMRVSALAFAVGGMVTAMGGVLISAFMTLDGSFGVVFTMKALIIVIMGGVGDVRGAALAALALGVAETAVATLIDPGLTLVTAYAIFLAALLLRPQGLFGRRAS